MKTFVCSICGTQNTYHGELTREFGPECTKCGSNSRYRYMAMLLAQTVWKQSVPLVELPRKEFNGVGTSEYIPLCETIGQKSNFKNTYFHYEKDHDLHLDITQPRERDWGKTDFILSSEVFEHIPSPVQRAFDGAAKLLKPGGVFLFTVPYTLESKTLEHFTDLHNFQLVTLDGEDAPVLVNRTSTGKLETYDKLIFHGGPGHTLEHRVFCKSSLQKHLSDAGFVQITFWEQNFPEWGAGWSEGWSRPITAIKA